MSKSWKTTLCGVIAAVPQIIVALSNVLPPAWANIVSSVAAAAGLIFAKDYNVTGGKVQQ
jgi:ethanolamine transporter EutH